MKTHRVKTRQTGREPLRDWITEKKKRDSNRISTYARRNVNLKRLNTDVLRTRGGRHGQVMKMKMYTQTRRWISVKLQATARYMKGLRRTAPTRPPKTQAPAGWPVGEGVFYSVIFRTTVGSVARGGPRLRTIKRDKTGDMDWIIALGNN